MTSIEWLEMELLNKMNGTPIVDKNLFDKAKEMHKLEISVAYEQKMHDLHKGLLRFGSKYYEETYNKD